MSLKAVSNAISQVSSKVTITNDTTTNATVYPTWVSATSGNQSIEVSSTKLTFNPGTGTFAIGTASPLTTTLLQVTSTLGRGITANGTMVSVDASTRQHIVHAGATFAPTSGSIISSAYEAVPIFAIPTGQVTTSAACLRASPFYTGNAGTITTSYGIWYDGGNTLPAGAITTAYGGYFAAPVAGTTKIALYADNMTMGGVLTGAELKNYSETVQTVVAASTTTIDYSAGGYVILTQDTNITTFTITNPTANNKACKIVIRRVKDNTGTSRTIVWPTTTKWAGGSAPTLSTTANAIDFYTLVSDNGGTTWYGFVGGQAFS